MDKKEKKNPVGNFGNDPIYQLLSTWRHSMNKVHKELFLNTSNEVNWLPKKSNFMHALKSASLAILPEIGGLAGLAIPC